MLFCLHKEVSQVHESILFYEGMEQLTNKDKLCQMTLSIALEGSQEAVIQKSFREAQMRHIQATCCIAGL